MNGYQKKSMNFEIDHYLFQKAYKKLKSNIYYDKTNLILRDKLVRFEDEHKNELDDYLDQLQSRFEKSKDEDWEDYITTKILNGIDCHLFPKSLSDKKSSKVITNLDDIGCFSVNKLQVFIDMNIEGHILGIVWLLLVGWKLDKELSYCYGNRIRKTLYNEFSEKLTFSPALFEPYFEKYESWRDNALKLAEMHLSKGDDILILTLDFTRFYYSVDISRKFMDDILEQIGDAKQSRCIVRINNFVFDVIEAYSKVYYQYFTNSGRNILPIGFLPSNVLANCVLKKFDEGIVNGWNPLYFGRYVDDVLIVDKIDKSHYLYQGLQEGTITVDNALAYYLVRENRWGKDEKSCGVPLFEKENKKECDEENCTEYKLCRDYTKPLGDKCEIKIKNEKSKIFYFSHEDTDALLTCFRENINRNKSEFRRMPEDEEIFQKDDYSEIFRLEQEEINKFRDVCGIRLDKFEFSKYLGKYQRISGLVDEKKETQFIRNIQKILTSRVIIENYTSWEKIISILRINGKERLFNDVVKKILDVIESLENVNEEELSIREDEKALCNMKCSLQQFLLSSIARVKSIWLKEKRGKYVGWIDRIFQSSSMQDDSLKDKYVDLSRKYRESRMGDKSMYVVWPDLFIDAYQHINKKRRSYSCNNMQDTLDLLQNVSKSWWKKDDKKEYKYYPYFITMYDLLISYQYWCMVKNFGFLKNFEEIQDIYIKKNFGLQLEKFKNKYSPISVKRFENGLLKKGGKNRFICVEGEPYSKIKIAISNIKMNQDDVEQHFIGSVNRTYKRYKQISYLMNTAIEHKANLLVMPECCVPMEWLEILSRTCAKNELAVVTGIEHMIVNEKVYNLVATILPFQKDGFRSAQIIFHFKNYFAPAEAKLIKGNGFTVMDANKLEKKTGNKQNGRYEIYKWHDFYFAVYCCFELTSITDRALFQSYVDAIIAIEWNRDVRYYSNILESLSRDLHCYCIQVNSSDFGDSRVTQPTKTERQDILRTKGGEEPSVLIGTIDIDALRKFQIKDFSLQQDDGRFKLTPPQLDKNIVYDKIHGKDVFRK